MNTYCEFTLGTEIRIHNPKNAKDYFIYIPGTIRIIEIRFWDSDNKLRLSKEQQKNFRNGISATQELAYLTECTVDLKIDTIKCSLYIKIGEYSTTYEISFNNQTEINNYTARIILYEEYFSTESFFHFLSDCRSRIKEDKESYDNGNLTLQELTNRKYTFQLKPTEKFSKHKLYEKEVFPDKE